jgi:hypothetical protein
MFQRLRKGTRMSALGRAGAMLAVLPLLAACGNKEPEVAPAAQQVQVSVSDRSIEMPPSVSAGKTLFTVTNTGKDEHSFGITGPAGDKVLEKALQPGESGTLELQLDDGTYRVYCPLDQGKAGATQIALDVHSAPQGSKG